MHVHCNLISGREKEEPIVQILEYEHSDHSVFNACVCLSTLVLFATPWHQSWMANLHKNPTTGISETKGWRAGGPRPNETLNNHSGRK